MRHPAYKDHLDSNDRKEIRRIFFCRSVGLYDVARDSFRQDVDWD